MVRLNIDPDKFKKQFIIFNRNESNNLAQKPILDVLTDRNCFLYDKATRTLFQHKNNNENVQIIGNTYFGTIGKHNETHNDYTNNKISGSGSFGTVLGLNNELNYNNNGGFVVGRYNNPNVSYLFTIGNGSDENNRSNLVQATDSTFSINGELEINGKNLNTIISGAADNETVQNLKNRVEALENKLSTLIDELQQLTILVDDSKTTETN